MGYTYSSKWNFIDCIASANQSITIDSAAGDISLGTITTPAYEGNLEQANLIMRVNGVKNTNVAENSIGPLAQKVQLRDASLVYRDAINFTNGDITLGGSTYQGFYEFLGSHDLSSYLSASGTYLCRWEDADANLDSLVLYGLQLWLRLYFGQ